MGSEYKRLYDYCQNQQPKIKRNIIRDKTLEIVSVPAVRVMMASMDVERIKGMFIAQGEHPHAKDTPLVILARGLNQCWERFVFVKELMHLFDSDMEQSTSQNLEALINDLFASGPELRQAVTPQLQSEYNAFWMALGCLCPEAYRLKAKEELKQGLADTYGIALRLKIPEQHVHHLVGSRYEEYIQIILDD
jgi:hypothetical protein